MNGFNLSQIIWNLEQLAFPIFVENNSSMSIIAKHTHKIPGTLTKKIIYDLNR